MKRLVYLHIFLAFACLGDNAYSHSGGLDPEIDHYNNRTGEYHYHHPKTAEQASAKPTQIQTISQAEKDRRLNEYFRSANENVGAVDCNLFIYERDLSDELKAKIRDRDGNRCVIFGSTLKLEVDHRRSLMNGGDNSEANLATLCDNCHTAKSKMDHSLKRKRGKVCKG